MNAQSFKKINRDNHKKLESSKLSIILLWFVFYIFTYIFNKTTCLSYRKKTSDRKHLKPEKVAFTHKTLSDNATGII